MDDVQQPKLEQDRVEGFVIERPFDLPHSSGGVVTDPVEPIHQFAIRLRAAQVSSLNPSLRFLNEALHFVAAKDVFRFPPRGCEARY